MTVPFALPFLASEPRATALLDDGFRRPAAWREEVRIRQGKRCAPALLEALSAQHLALPSSPARERNLAALSDPGTTAVVTGQQVGLFLGPLYTFYKAASAIAWARAIETETAARCVPVFWLQTEDHDFAEIASCEVPPALRLSLPPSDARCSVAHLTLAHEVSGLVEELTRALSPLPHAAQVLDLVRASYQPGRGLAQAFASLLAAVFAEEGLLFLDPRCPGIARLSSPLYVKAIEDADEIDAALSKRGAELSAAGLTEQVHVRKGSPLVFFHGDRVDGPRRRLQREGAGFLLDGGGVISRSALLDAARNEPLRFSSSALLRPIVQDALLPSVAYVGGPAELGYLAQTAPLYPLFGVRPALAVPRARFRLLDARAASTLNALGLTPADVEAPREELLARLSNGRASGEDLAGRLLGPLTAQLAESGRKHPELARAARRTQVSIERAVSRYAARHAQLVANQDRTLAERVDRLQATLFPRGEPQERVHSLPFYAARHGLAALKTAVLGALDPRAPPAVRDLTP
ncbi:MAG TPA: bacillithiol biosynthesis cysteine-adding enzyme BshC [Myxococcales bacterium]|nr:bacillithiol biosynthesis cysteine-adding enzyme BshC [Myxococcales bacterium]